MNARPIQLSDAAFLMLRKAFKNLDINAGLPLDAASFVPAAELVEAEYATVLDAEGGIELRATPTGVRYMEMIDAVLAHGPNWRAAGKTPG